MSQGQESTKDLQAVNKQITPSISSPNRTPGKKAKKKERKERGKYENNCW